MLSVFIFPFQMRLTQIKYLWLCFCIIVQSIGFTSLVIKFLTFPLEFAWPFLFHVYFVEVEADNFDELTYENVGHHSLYLD